MKDGFYWTRLKDGQLCQIVLVDDGKVYLAGDEDYFYLDRFEEGFEFVSTEPLEPPDVCPVCDRDDCNCIECGKRCCEECVKNDDDVHHTYVSRREQNEQKGRR